MSKTVMIAKLDGGVLVVGEQEADGGDLLNCMELNVQGTQNGIRIGLIPVLAPFSDKIDGTNIDEGKIVACVEAEANLTAKYYEAKTGITIMPPDTKIPENVVKLK